MNNIMTAFFLLFSPLRSLRALREISRPGFNKSAALSILVFVLIDCAAFRPGGRFEGAFKDCPCYEEVVHFPSSTPVPIAEAERTPDDKPDVSATSAGAAKELGADRFLEEVYEGMRRDFEAHGIRVTPIEDGFRATGVKVEKVRDKKRIRELLVSVDGDICFAHGSALVTPAAAAVLERVSDVLIKYPDINIKVGGHTDSTGSKAYNYGLSQNRAQSTTDLLIKKSGISRSRVVEIKGFADDQRIIITPLAEVRNRRVEIRMAP